MRGPHRDFNRGKWTTGRLIDADPKSHAGTRTVAFPKEIVPELRWRLECFAQADDDGGLVFIGPLGGRLRRSSFRKFWQRPGKRSACPDCIFMICALAGALTIC